MIIGCTGNYRKEEYYTILERVIAIIENSDVTFLISDDLKKNMRFQIPDTYSLVEFSPN